MCGKPVRWRHFVYIPLTVLESNFGILSSLRMILSTMSLEIDKDVI